MSLTTQFYIYQRNQPRQENYVQSHRYQRNQSQQEHYIQPHRYQRMKFAAWTPQQSLTDVKKKLVTTRTTADTYKEHSTHSPTDIPTDIKEINHNENTAKRSPLNIKEIGHDKNISGTERRVQNTSRWGPDENRLFGLDVTLIKWLKIGVSSPLTVPAVAA